MFEGVFSIEQILADAPAQREQLNAKLDLLDSHLAQRGPFMLGEAASLVDFEFSHPIFALKSIPETVDVLAPFPNLLAWEGRVEEFGHGTFSDMSGGEAVEIAAGGTPAPVAQQDPSEPNARKPGDEIRVVHENFGNDPVVGEFVSSSLQEIALRCVDERAGEVVVHFPREHYMVSDATPA